MEVGMGELALRCHCGAVAGRASGVGLATATGGVHIVCMCDDCQAYAHYLQTAGRVLDDYGGTGIYQLTPAQLSLVRGRSTCVVCG